MDLWKVVRILPTDYKDYGGDIDRWSDPNESYPDCSSGCDYYRRLVSQFEEGIEDADWGVCTNSSSPRRGLLTWEHQAGYKCYSRS